MAQRDINPRILRELAEFIGSDHPRAESVMRKVLKLSKTHGVYAGDYERPARHFSPPEFVGKNGRAPKYPFYKMEPGESYWFDRSTKTAALDAARVFGKRNDRAFTHRPEGDGGVRIWRVS